MIKDLDIISKSGNNVRFRVEGLRELDADLQRMSREVVSERAKKALVAAMKPIQVRVRRNLLMNDILDTGSLSQWEGQGGVRMTSALRPKYSSVQADVRAGVGGKRGRYKKSGKRKPHYALQVEEGTKDSAFGPLPAQPFMRPAFDGQERAIATRLRQFLRNQIIIWKMRGPK